jgi:uncharacterized protein (TIGR02453 family)
MDTAPVDTALILDFLKNLQKNNNKEWMDAHRAAYEIARDAFKEIVSILITEVIRFDEDLAGLAPKDCIFRINRDIRFSKDKTPYKTNFGAALSEGGRRSPNAVYYLHLQPYDESFIAGGMYMPDKEYLAKIRQEVDYNPEELKKIVKAPDFKKYFGSIQGEKFSRPPKGYDITHPNIELLKLKSFIVIHRFTDEKVTSENFITNIIPMYQTIQPFIRYLNVAIS